MKEVNTYAPSPDPEHHNTFQADLFKPTGLADTSPTLTIEVTGQKDPAALRATGIIDAFDVTTSGTRRQETFTGTSVSWIGYRGPRTGIARVIHDGSMVADSLDS